jgi:hypothetical protein
MHLLLRNLSLAAAARPTQAFQGLLVGNRRQSELQEIVSVAKP